MVVGTEIYNCTDESASIALFDSLKEKKKEKHKTLCYILFIWILIGRTNGHLLNQFYETNDNIDYFTCMSMCMCVFLCAQHDLSVIEKKNTNIKYHTEFLLMILTAIGVASPTNEKKVYISNEGA